MQISRLNWRSNLLTLVAILSTSALAGGYQTPSVTPQQMATEVPNGLSPALLKELQSGGLVIYIRHATTETDYADQVSAEMGNCATQRVLSEMGWQQARTIGQSFRELNIPVGNVYSSEYCRAWQTADLTFGRYQKLSQLNFYPAAEFTEAQMAMMAANVQPMLAAAPAAGTNTVIVAHDDPFEAATGIYPEPQGVAYVVRPGGDQFTLLARIPADAWK